MSMPPPVPRCIWIEHHETQQTHHEHSSKSSTIMSEKKRNKKWHERRQKRAIAHQQKMGYEAFPLYIPTHNTGTDAESVSNRLRFREMVRQANEEYTPYIVQNIADK